MDGTALSPLGINTRIKVCFSPCPFSTINIIFFGFYVVSQIYHKTLFLTKKFIKEIEQKLIVSMGPTDFILYCIIQKSLDRKAFEDSTLVSAERQHLQDGILTRASRTIHGPFLPKPKHMGQSKC